MEFIEDLDPNLHADLGATTYILNNEGKLNNSHLYNRQEKLFVGNGENLDISHIGQRNLNTP